MKANCWAGRNEVEVRDVPDPGILNRRDAVVRITSTAIFGSDLHLLDGDAPTSHAGGITGPEVTGGDVVGRGVVGQVVGVGRGGDPARLRIGDRVVVPFPIACGACSA